MKVLALDLSLNGSGMVLLETVEDKVAILNWKYVDNKKIKCEAEKLSRIEAALKELLDTFDIGTYVREKGFSRYPATTQKLFKVVGVSDLVVWNVKKETLEEIPPTSVKAKITGKSKAEKDVVQEEVRKYLTEEQRDFVFVTDDVSDALAVGVTCLLNKGVLLTKE